MVVRTFIGVEFMRDETSRLALKLVEETLWSLCVAEGDHGFGNGWKSGFKQRNDWLSRFLRAYSLRVIIVDGCKMRLFVHNLHIISFQLPSIIRFLQLDFQTLCNGIHFILPLIDCMLFMMLGSQSIQNNRSG